MIQVKTDKKNINGILLVDKPKDISSFAALKILKKNLNIKKIGHAGTLDPLATGLLIVCIGKATKLVKYFEKFEKEYIANIHFGITTDTYDAEGKTISESQVELTPEIIKNVLLTFKGQIEQMPPIYSAIKIKGKPAYKYAREGKEVELKKRVVNIYEIELLNFVSPFCEIRVKCSKGTYIRSLAYDLGQMLGCGGHIKDLRRTKAGIFSIEQAVNVDEKCDVLKKKIIPVNESISFLPYIIIKNEYKQKILNGIKPEPDFFQSDFNNAEGLYRLVDEKQSLLAITRFNFKTGFKFEKVFNSGNI